MRCYLIISGKPASGPLEPAIKSVRRTKCPVISSCSPSLTHTNNMILLMPLHHSRPPPLIRAASLYAIPTPLLRSMVLLTVRHLLLRRRLLEHSHSVFLLSPLIFLSITASSFSILMVLSFPKEFRASFCWTATKRDSGPSGEEQVFRTSSIEGPSGTHASLD
jgi:hypothetical protein